MRGSLVSTRRAAVFPSAGPAACSSAGFTRASHIRRSAQAVCPQPPLPELSGRQQQPVRSRLLRELFRTPAGTSLGTSPGYTSHHSPPWVHQRHHAHAGRVTGTARVRGVRAGAWAQVHRFAAASMSSARGPSESVGVDRIRALRVRAALPRRIIDDRIAQGVIRRWHLGAARGARSWLRTRSCARAEPTVSSRYSEARCGATYRTSSRGGGAGACG